jgi:hypothetical protein
LAASLLIGDNSLSSRNDSMLRKLNEAATAFLKAEHPGQGQVDRWKDRAADDGGHAGPDLS